MRIASLDLGTNTFLCLIADVENGQIRKKVLDEARVVRLGQGMDANREFHEEALERCEFCLKEFRQFIDQNNVDKVVAVATSASRDAKNKEKFLAILEKYNIPVRVISGDKEAELTFLGATFDLKNKKNLAVIDVGGGSTEIIFMNSKAEIKGKSLDIGSVRLTERWVNNHPLSAESLANVRVDIQKQLKQFSESYLQEEFKSGFEISKIVAVAGTPSTLTCLALGKDFVEDEVHGFLLTEERLTSFIEKLAAMDLKDRRAMPGMQKGREDVIVAGAMILRESLKIFSKTEMSVSTKGVRYGLAIEEANTTF